MRVGRRDPFHGAQRPAHRHERVLVLPGTDERELVLLLVTGMIENRLFEFAEHVIELRAGDVHHLQDSQGPGGFSLLLIPRIDDLGPGVLAADGPQHHFLGGFVDGQQGAKLIEGPLLALPFGALPSDVALLLNRALIDDSGLIPERLL